MAFVQLTYRESLRDIETCLRAMKTKRYHMGIRSGISRNNLSSANQTRDWRIYAEEKLEVDLDMTHLLALRACMGLLNPPSPRRSHCVYPPPNGCA